MDEESLLARTLILKIFGGQLLSFLAYDLVLIVPFLSLFKTVQTEYLIGLIVYVTVLNYSGALAVYYLFIHPQTRFGS